MQFRLAGVARRKYASVARQSWEKTLQQFRAEQNRGKWDNKELYDSTLFKLAASGRSDEFLSIWREMKQRSIEKCDQSYFNILKLCNVTRNWGFGYRCLVEMQESGVQIKMRHIYLVLETFARKNKAQQIEEIISKLPSMNVEPDAKCFKYLLQANVDNDLETIKGLYKEGCARFSCQEELDVFMVQAYLKHRDLDEAVRLWGGIDGSKLGTDAQCTLLLEAGKVRCEPIAQDLINGTNISQSNRCLHSVMFACMCIGLHEKASKLFDRYSSKDEYAFTHLIRGAEIAGNRDASEHYYSLATQLKLLNPWKTDPKWKLLMDFHGWDALLCSASFRFHLTRFGEKVHSMPTLPFPELIVMCGRGKHSAEKWKPTLLPQLLQVLEDEFAHLSFYEHPKYPGLIAIDMKSFQQPPLPETNADKSETSIEEALRGWLAEQIARDPTNHPTTAVAKTKALLLARGTEHESTFRCSVSFLRNFRKQHPNLGWKPKT